MRPALYVWLAFISCAAAHAFEPEIVSVGKNAFAIVGEIGPRTPDNHALNNTLGFVVTQDSVVLIGSGATPTGAQLLEQAVASVTDKPIRVVVTIGAQDHHWMGTSYFVQKGIATKALKRTVDSQRRHAEAHLERLKAQIGEEANTVTPVFAVELVEEDQQSFRIGGIDFKLLWPGDGHFEGDAILWVPSTRTVFTGDFVFHDRILGIQDSSPVAEWRQSFHVIEQLNPAHVVPGHGYPGDLDKAKRDTGDYLDWLTQEVGKALDDWQELSDTVEQLADAPGFLHLKFYESWHKRNIHQTYVQFESGR